MRDEIIRTVLVIVAVFSFLYTLRGVFLWSVERLYRKDAAGTLLVIAVSGDGENAEEKLFSVRALTMRNGGELFEPVLLDLGLSEEGRRLCRLLCKRENLRLICDTSELLAFLDEKNN